MKKVDNTTEQVKNNPTIGLIHAMNIPAQESAGQRQLVESCQLPAKWNNRGGSTLTLIQQYEAMGIKVLGLDEAGNPISKSDPLFLEVELPTGWKKRSTSHSMWNELVDDKGRVRATFFYKAAFYDRDAFINFENRFGIRTTTYMPEEKRGKYKMQEVTVRNPQFNGDAEGVIERDGRKYVTYRDDAYGTAKMYSVGEEFITTEEKVWVRKYRNDYQEKNHTPMYFEVSDGKEVIYSNKKRPVYFRKRYSKRYHQKWWKDYEACTDSLRAKAERFLNKKYPDWKNINAYWN